jgi:hypothetical protein
MFLLDKYDRPHECAVTNCTGVFPCAGGSIAPVGEQGVAVETVLIQQVLSLVLQVNFISNLSLERVD